MNQMDKDLSTLRRRLQESRDELVRVREKLTRQAVSLVVLSAIREFPTAIEITVECWASTVRLVSIHDEIRTLWHADRDEPTRRTRNADKVLAFAREHGGLDPATRPGWQRCAEVTAYGMWDIRITEEVAYPHGSGMRKPHGLRLPAAPVTKAEDRD